MNNKEFTLVTNPYNTNRSEIDKLLDIHGFNNRITDAVQSIKDGLGDCIVLSMYNGIKVYKYKDTEFGAHVRNTTLAGFKDTKFGWVIKYDAWGFSSSVYLTNNCNIMSYYDVTNPSYTDKILYFSDYNSAFNYMENMKNKAEKYAEEYKQFKEEDQNLKNKVKEIRDEGLFMFKLFKTYVENTGLCDYIIAQEVIGDMGFEEYKGE